MKIESQVVSLDLSKQLKEAGYPQEGYFVWIQDFDNEIKLYDDTQMSDYFGCRSREICIAPTVAELGEALPDFHYSKYSKNTSKSILEKHYLTHSYNLRKTGVREKTCYDEIRLGDNNSEADARAKMWLYLKEKGLL